MEKTVLSVAASLVVSMTLVGCGGDSNSNDKEAEVEVVINTQVADTADLVLTNITYNGFDTAIELNQEASGTVSDYHTYLYTAQSDGYVSVVLEGEALDDSNLGLHVLDWDGTVEDWTTWNEVSQELSIIKVVQGHQYELAVTQYVNSAKEHYTLTVAELNRELLGLEEDEYLTLATEDITFNCVENGEQYTDEFTSMLPVVLNFKSGYLLDSDGERITLDSVSDTGFKISETDTQQYDADGESGVFTFSAVFNGTFNDDKSAADLTSTRTYSDISDSYSNVCDDTGTGRFDFIL